MCRKESGMVEGCFPFCYSEIHLSISHFGWTFCPRVILFLNTEFVFAKILFYWLIQSLQMLTYLISQYQNPHFQTITTDLIKKIWAMLGYGKHSFSKILIFTWMPRLLPWQQMPTLSLEWELTLENVCQALILWWKYITWGWGDGQLIKGLL